MDEYRHIQQLRELWSQGIMTWLRVMVPIGAGIFGLFAYIGQLGQIRTWPWAPLFPFFGWCIFAIFMITWRFVVHHIDRQIVGMYPRMIELEQHLRMATNTRYYFNNLSERGRAALANGLGIDVQELRRRDNRRLNYRRYERMALGQGQDPYVLLLGVWDALGYDSVGDRGHRIQNTAVILVILLSLALAFLLAWWLLPTC